MSQWSPELFLQSPVDRNLNHINHESCSWVTPENLLSFSNQGPCSRASSSPACGRTWSMCCPRRWRVAWRAAPRAWPSSWGRRGSKSRARGRETPSVWVWTAYGRPRRSAAPSVGVTFDPCPPLTSQKRIDAVNYTERKPRIRRGGESLSWRQRKGKLSRPGSWD